MSSIAPAPLSRMRSDFRPDEKRVVFASAIGTAFDRYAFRLCVTPAAARWMR
jgi:hypothetical protein